ncbi:hypothetical protein JW948_12775 [bacterium]|nr:hypothetical protein [bacterium]
MKKRLLAGNTKVRFNKISADTAIPPFIKSIFQGHVEKYIQTESPIVVQATPHFDLTDKDLTHLKDRFHEVFRDVACFSDEEVEQVLRSALILRMDYIVKPVDTMRRILFDGQNSISLEEMDISLSPFYKVLSYAELLIEECRRLSHTSIESDEYSNLINEILHRKTESEPLKLVIHDFSVLTDFLSEAKGEEVGRVEGQVVQEFMADRNLWSFRRAVDVEMKLGKEEFDAVELEMTLKRYLELKSEFSQNEQQTTKTAEPVPEPTEIESFENILEDAKEIAKEEPEGFEDKVFMEPADDEEEKSGPEPEFQIEESPMQMEDLELNEVNQDEAVDLDDIVGSTETGAFTDDVKIKPPETKKDQPDEGWDLDDVLGSETLIQDDSSEKAPEKPPEPKNIAPAPERKSEEKPQPKKQMRIIRRDQSPASDMNVSGSRGLEDKTFSAHTGLRQMIDSKTEKVFVKKLFGNDQNAYDHLMNKLEESESWRVAKILIDNELFKRDVDPFSREAIKLVDLVYSRYYPEEGVGGK